MTHNAPTKTLLSCTLITALSLFGCDDDDGTPGGTFDSGVTVPEGGNTGSTGADAAVAAGNAIALDGGIDAAVSTANALYAVPTEVYGADFASSTSYVPVVASLDVASISIQQAREVDGRASVGRVGKYVFIASANAPIANRFVVGEQGALQADGSISFANESLPPYFSIDHWGALFISETKAYIFNGSDGSIVVWNPTSLTITGKIAGPGIVRPGYEIQSAQVVRGNKLYRLFSLVNYDEWDFLTSGQLLVVYDLDADKQLSSVEENRCPQLYATPFVTEGGDIYFSGWVWPATLPLVRDFPRSCTLRVLAGQDRFDPSYKLDYAAKFGHEGAMLSYLGNGQALVDLFHQERATITPSTDPQDLANTKNWRVWKIDLASGTGAPLEGIDYTGAGYSLAQVDKRNFLLTPDDETYSATTATEIVGGALVPSFKIKGSTYSIVRVR
jgi:hypothetical protein